VHLYHVSIRTYGKVYQPQEAYGIAGNGNGNGNRNCKWKQKIEMEMDIGNGNGDMAQDAGRLTNVPSTYKEGQHLRKRCV